MTTDRILLYIFIPALVTYLVRMAPLVLFRGKITNRFFRSFLHYLPFTVLVSMTFPAVFFSTGSVLSAVIGTAAAVVLAFMNKSLIIVALGAVAASAIIDALPSLISLIRCI